ncbi:hypothetical protein TRAPUB_10344 [Trametes pubescens]|uniref:Uncharacterized protein n=1 Tax=Trametes pubescens TaxID=154538 RepID=A0A1M2VZU9_TRAPU|nr:hypothetical protein TRAPUB_10344 [Trametes pubescens]
MTSPFDRDFDQWIQSSSSGGGERPSLDGAFSNFSVQATFAAASLQGGYRAEYRHLQDQGHSDTHSSGPSYSPPPPSQAYPLQESSSFDDAPARDLHSAFGYPQEWTEGATTGVDPSQVLWAGRPSASSSSSSSADPPLVNPSVAPSALSQPPRPQVPPPALVHSRLDFFLQPASFTPAPHAHNLPCHSSSSTAGEPQKGPRGDRKRARDDKENDTSYTSTPSSRPEKRVRHGEEQPGHNMPTATISQPVLAPAMCYNTSNATARTQLATPERVSERPHSRSDYLSSRYATHPANDHVRLPTGSSPHSQERGVIGDISSNSFEAAYPGTSSRTASASLLPHLGRFGHFPQGSARPGRWNTENAAYQPQHNGGSNAHPPFMGAHAPTQGDGYHHAPRMDAPYSYPPPAVPWSLLHAAPPIPDARPTRPSPDVIPPSLSRHSPLQRSQRTLAPRAPALQNTTPASTSATPQGERSVAQELYPGSNSIEAQRRRALGAARRTQARRTAVSPRAPLGSPPANIPSSSPVVQQHLPPAPKPTKPVRRNPPPVAATQDATTHKFPCPMPAIVAENPGRYAASTSPLVHCRLGLGADAQFSRQCDSERHFQGEHLAVRYRLLRGPHRGCGAFSRRDALKRHVEGCRKWPGAPRVLGRLEVLMPCWKSSEWHEACSARDRRKWEKYLGEHGVLVYECECCKVRGEDAESAGAPSRACTPEETPVKIKEEEVDEAGVLYRSESQPHSDTAYESEEDAPCAPMATTGGEPQITQEQAFDEDGRDLYFPNDPWVGFGGEDGEAGTDSDTSGSEHAGDTGGPAAVQAPEEDSGSHMSQAHAPDDTAASPSAPAHNRADNWPSSPPQTETLADPGPIQDTFTNTWDSLVSDEDEYDADADGSDSETDAYPVEGLQQRQPAGLVVE